MARKGISLEEKRRILTEYLLEQFKQGKERIVLQNSLCVELLNHTSSGILQFLRYQILAQKKNIFASLDRSGRGRERLGRPNAPMCYMPMSDEEMKNHVFIEDDFKYLTVNQVQIVTDKLRALGFDVWDRYIFLLMIDLFYAKNNDNNWAYISPKFYSENLLKSQAETQQMLAVLCDEDIFKFKIENGKTYYRAAIAPEDASSEDTDTITEILTYAEGRKKTYEARKKKAKTQKIMAKKIEYNLWSNGNSMNADELSMQEKYDLLMGTASAETVQRFEQQKQEQLLCTIRDPNQIAIRQKIGVVPDVIEKKVAELFSMKEASVNNEEDVDLKSVNAIKQEYESMNKFDRQNVGTLIEFLKNPLYKRMLQQFNMLIERQEPLSLQPIMPGGPKLAYPYYKIELIGTILRLLFELVDVLAAEETDSYGNSQPNEDRTKELEAENAMLRNNLNELKENTDKSSKVFDMVSKQLAAVKEENDILKKRYKDIQNDNKQILAWQAKVQADCENAINRFNGNVATEIGILAQSNNFQKDRGKFSAKMFSLVSDLTRTVQKTAKIKSLDEDDWGGDDWD